MRIQEQKTNTPVYQEPGRKTPTRDDIAILLGPEGLFAGLKDPDIDLILSISRLRTYGANEVLFTQGEYADTTPLFCVLSGHFGVFHEYVDSRGKKHVPHVSTDGPNVFIGDVEMLLRGHDIGQIDDRPLTTDNNWSTLKCLDSGRVLRIFPSNRLLEIDDPRLAWNVARALAIKLLRRSAQADPWMVKKGKEELVVHVLRDKAKLAWETQGKPKQVELQITLRHLAESAECAQETVRWALKRIKNAYGDDFRHETNGKMLVPETFVMSNDVPPPVKRNTS